ncbi:MAG: hypothetical protein A3D10_05140 [Omnitrophica WOR_2 bacterium RIFCSPHIGHO2_02_FULL_48_11]|nr:MAG: hypothetical protein A3D10_05140 [Omnitrophica WOR_2 bacterium RIFCSPHIGHO2_02_FULL_48_11]
MLYIGLTKKEISFFPRPLCYLQRVAFLFTNGIQQWPVYYFQALPENSEDWITLREEEYFQLQPFGYRTRIYQMFLPFVHYAMGYESQWQKTSLERNEELAAWLKQRYEAIHPQSLRLKAIQFVVVYYDINENFSLEGHWRPPPLEFFAPEKIKILSTHHF